MNEQVNASMERKVITDDGVQFDNQYVTIDEEKVAAEVAEQEARAREEAMNFKPVLPKLKRTKEGLIQAEDGIEISSILDILKPGDNINHQTVIDIKDGQIELEYFGTKSTIKDENEIFSVLIKEELDYWLEYLKDANIARMFEDTEPQMLTLFRSLELMCMNINMNEVTHLTTSEKPIDQRIISMLIGTLRKPLLEDNVPDNCKAIAVAKDYSSIVDMDNKDIILYRVALTNLNNLPVKEGDKIILC